MPTTRQIYCYEENKIYDSTKQYSVINNISITTVNRVCNRKKQWSTQGKHLFWYDEYINMTVNEIEKIINHKTTRKNI